MRAVTSEIEALKKMSKDEIKDEAKRMRVSVDLVKQVQELGRLPVVNFAAGGVVPASRYNRIWRLVAAVRRAGRISVMTGTGVTMAPGANVTEWLRLALLVVTGSIDRPAACRCSATWSPRTWAAR